jgi:hypothetical protein
MTAPDVLAPGTVPVFVLGSGRCGSTLVQEVLARHHAMAFISNIDDRLARLDTAGRWNNALYRRVPERFTQKGRIRFAPSEGYRLMERAVSPMLVAPNRDLIAADASPWLSARMQAVVTRRLTAQRRTVFLHKFTGWPRARFLQAVFPEARFINIVRDGRAVANSWLQMSWWTGYRGVPGWTFGDLPTHYHEEWEAGGRTYSLLAAIGWKMLLDVSDECAQSLKPGSWLEVRYEDILADPLREFTTMLEFMGVSSDRAFDRTVSGFGFSNAREKAFRTDLDAETLTKLDASLESHLIARGYEV